LPIAGFELGSPRSWTGVATNELVFGWCTNQKHIVLLLKRAKKLMGHPPGIAFRRCLVAHANDWQVGARYTGQVVAYKAPHTPSRVLGLVHFAFFVFCFVFCFLFSDFFFFVLFYFLSFIFLFVEIQKV
jgi:hypothetical protein